MSTAEQIAAALRAQVPPDLQADVDALAAVLEAVNTRRLSPDEARARLGENRALAPLLQALAGREVATASALLSFGAESALGDVTIRDIAGGNIVHLTVNQYYDAEPGADERRAPGALPLWAIGVAAVILALALGAALWAVGGGGNVAASPTAAPSVSVAPTRAPTVGPAPAFETRFSFDGTYPALSQLVAEPGYRPTLPLTDTITVVGIDVGLAGAAEQRLAWNVRLQLKNTSDQPWQLELRPGFFSLSDNLGRSAPLVYWCCPASPTELLLPGEARDIQLIFESVDGWYGKTRGVNELILRVQGLLPIVRADWSMPPLLTAD